MAKILVVDDEKNVRRILKDFLENEGFEVLLGNDGEHAVDVIMAHSDIDLILLDVRMPKLGGFEVIASIKAMTDASVIFLTALDESFDEIRGLELGADDYITKPFNYKVLMARVNATLRKNGRLKQTCFAYETLKIDDSMKAVLIDDVPIDLALKEYELLKYLSDNINISIDRFKMLDRIWGYDYEGDIRTVDTHVKTLRAKLGRYQHLIKTVRGVGYRFEIPKV
jgi:DNA-binding response OmpR family regulator